MFDVFGALVSLDDLAGASGFLKSVIDALTPGLRQKLSENIVHSGLVYYEVPANHHLPRAFRRAWCRACEGIIDRARKGVEAGAPIGCSREDFDAFVVTVRGVANAISIEAAGPNPRKKLSESSIDKSIKPGLTLLSDHVLRETQEIDRKQLELAFLAWITEVTGLDATEIPPIVQKIVHDSKQSDDATDRGFPYLLLDQLAHFYHHSQEYPEGSHSIKLAIDQLQYRTLKQSLDRLMERTETSDERDQVEAVRSTVVSELQGISDQLEALRRQTSIDAERIIDEIGGLRGEIASSFGSAARSLALRSNIPNVLLASDGNDTALNLVASTLTDATDQLVGPNAVEQVVWPLDKIDVKTALKPEAWRHLLHSDDAKHIASVVLIGNTIGQPLEQDPLFEERLAERGLLATPQAPDGAFFQLAYDAQQRLLLKRQGAVPLTAETRLIFETYLADRTLRVCDQSDPASRDGWVDNLLNWLNKCHFAALDETAREESNLWATSLVREIFDIPQDAIPNPYLRLVHFTPGDDDRYRGREDAAASIERAFQTARAEEKPVLIRIEGASGVGKSSFMNVRVASVAKAQGFTYFTFRPSDLLQQANERSRPLVAFCDELSRLLGCESPRMTHPLVMSPVSEHAYHAAKDWLASCLTVKDRFVIAVDQFEEIVDNIANDWDGGSWRVLVDLLEHVAGPRIAIVATLESSRREAFARLWPNGAIAQAFVVELSDNDAFLREVIERPFAEAGYRLDAETVEKLLDEARIYGTEAGETISALPLLALKLYTLFDHVTREFQGRSAVRSLDLISVPHGRIRVPLDIGAEIENLAWAAWNEVAGDDRDLDVFLRPFIRVVAPPGDDRGRMVLATVPSRGFFSVAYRQTAFERRRLVIPAPGGYRLAHEAVIRRWSKANAWFEAERAALLAETRFLEESVAWDRKGRPQIQEAADASIATAARILNSRSTDWSTVDPASSVERAYCLAHFELSSDPCALVDNSPSGSHYVHIAAAYGLNDLMERYLDANPEACNLAREKDKRTPLMTAGFVSAEMVRLLLRRGADPDLIEEQGWTAIDSTIWGDVPDAFSSLLERADPVPGETVSINPLYSAARCRRMDFIHRLEARGWRHDRPTVLNATPLIGAAISGDPTIFRHCLAHGDPSYRPANDANAFDTAAQMGNIQVMQLILAHEKGEICLHGKTNTGWTPLIFAAFHHKPDAIRMLVNTDVDVNARIDDGNDYAGSTALHCALDWLARFDGRASRFVVDMTRDSVAALLTCSKIDVNMQDGKGRTPWQMAQHHPSIQSLIEQHPSFSFAALPPSVKSPLDRAVENGDVELLRELLANDEMRPLAGRVLDGSTPAQAMCSMGLTALVADLVREGHVKAWSWEGGNLFGPAWRAKDPELIDLVLQRMPELLSARELNAVLLTAIAEPNGRPPTQPPPDDALIDRCIAAAADQDVLDAALETAGRQGSMEVFQRLKRAGANPDRTDGWGRAIADRASDIIATEEGRSVSGWEPNGSEADGRPISSDEREIREILASGQLDKIEEIIAAWPSGMRRDDWGRGAVDLVPDMIVDAVRDLVRNAEQEDGK